LYPERRARGFLEALVDGDLSGVWAYATEEERSRANKEAFERVYRSIVGERLGGWKRDGPVTVSWLDDEYLTASVPVRCGGGTRFVATVTLRVRRGGTYGNVVLGFMYLLEQYIAKRDGIPRKEARRKSKAEFRPLFEKEGITKFYSLVNGSWYLWDGSEVSYDQVRGRWYKWDGSEVQK
ncbi:MAG: hypothetical protein K6T17_07355, partial [Fimbriimonadales bacterium]|nr:hypothetical protein [Fimbriimonadales bacterium]